MFGITALNIVFHEALKRLIQVFHDSTYDNTLSKEFYIKTGFSNWLNVEAWPSATFRFQFCLNSPVIVPYSKYFRSQWWHQGRVLNLNFSQMLSLTPSFLVETLKLIRFHLRVHIKANSAGYKLTATTACYTANAKKWPHINFFIY